MRQREGSRKNHSCRVIHSSEDREWVGLCSEFPDLSWLDPVEVKAFKGIRALVQEVVEDMVEQGEPVPEAVPRN
ncbi:antitoxin HicB [Formicincola oecophyllae]|uniref:Antitoxin HicB n=1 Tax=Formicincola oecophyllae TaxID=2558361 RepID=A0A4Y6UAN7_9PROT|nr:antitoxin HicB [Formicincola oecophyllae]